MIGAGKLLGKASPLGSASRMSGGSAGPINDVAKRQSSEGIARNAEVYHSNPAVNQDPIKQNLTAKVGDRGAAGYEGGRSAYIEMDNTGYSALAKNAPNRQAVASPAQSNTNVSAALPELFSPHRNKMTDYRKFRGNLNR